MISEFPILDSELPFKAARAPLPRVICIQVSYPDSDSKRRGRRFPEWSVSRLATRIQNYHLKRRGRRFPEYRIWMVQMVAKSVVITVLITVVHSARKLSLGK